MTSRIPAVIALLAALAGAAHGDVVKLKSGRRLVGRAEETANGVRITMDGGVLTIPRDQVESIERTADPREEASRRAAGVPDGDVAAALAAAEAAEKAGLADEAGRVLQRAAQWAPDDPRVREAVFRWSAYVRRIPPDPDADARLLSSFGKGGRLHLSDHFRIVHDVDPDEARRRGELLETAYRKVYELADRTGVDARPLGRRLDVALYADHARWAAAIGRPADELRGLSGLFVPERDRVYLFDLRTMPESVAAAADAERGRTEIAAFDASLGDLRTKVDTLAAEVSAATSARDDRRRETAEGLLREARAVLRTQQDRLDTARERLARFQRSLEQSSERENLSSTTHEACHQISFATGMCRPGQPLWLLEGLATLFEVTSRTAFVLDASNELRLTELRRAWDAGRSTSIADVLSDAVFLAPGADRGVAYAEAWSLAYFLMRKRPKDLARLLTEGRLVSALPESAAARIEDARRLLGEDLAAIEREWKADVRAIPLR